MSNSITFHFEYPDLVNADGSTGLTEEYIFGDANFNQARYLLKEAILLLEPNGKKPIKFVSTAYPKDGE